METAGNTVSEIVPAKISKLSRAEVLSKQAGVISTLLLLRNNAVGRRDADVARRYRGGRDLELVLASGPTRRMSGLSAAADVSC